MIRTMLSNFFKRPTPAPEKPAAPQPVNGPSFNIKERRFVARPLPQPEVIEGNGDAEWALWAEATREQDKR